MECTLSGANTPAQRVHGSDRRKGELRIPQSSSITEALQSDFLVLSRLHAGRGF